MDSAAQQVTPGPVVIVEPKEEGLLPDKDMKEVHAAYEEEVKKFYAAKEQSPAVEE